MYETKNATRKKLWTQIYDKQQLWEEMNDDTLLLEQTKLYDMKSSTKQCHPSKLFCTMI